MNCVTGGVIVADAKFDPVVPEGVDARLFAVPITAIAEELGTSLMKNMVASGASWALARSADRSLSTKRSKKNLDAKGQLLSRKILKRFQARLSLFVEIGGGPLAEFQLEPADGKQKLFMIGNEAIGLGAIAAGCRLMSAYPITPASEIMEYLIKKLAEIWRNRHSDGRRNRGRYDGDRRQLCRRSHDDRIGRTGSVADDGSDWLGGHDGNAGRHRGYAARRPVTRACRPSKNKATSTR